MIIKVLIVDPNIGFAVPIKRALELSGDYDVRVFANGRAAVEMVQREPQHIAVLDFSIIDMTLPQLINELRIVQPELFILTSPRTASDIAQLPSLDAQGSVTKPYLARQLIPVIKEAITAKTRLDTQQNAKRDLQPTSDFLDPARRQKSQRVEEPVMKPDDTFYRLAQAMYGGLTSPHQPTTKFDLPPEPPETSPDDPIISEPEISEDATIGELVSGQSTPLSGVAISGTVIIEQEPDHDLYATRPLAVLEAINSNNVSFNDLSSPAFVARIEEAKQHYASQSNPSDFLAQDEPPISFDDTLPSGRMKPAQQADPTIADSELSKPVGEQAIEQDLLDGDPDAMLDQYFTDDATDSSRTTADNVARQPTDLPHTMPEPEPTPIAVAEEPVANVATQLTQITLGTAAEATLVTRGNELVSAAGQLAPRAIAGLVELISEAWRTNDQAEQDSSANGINAIVRYINLPDAGDYLLYSTPTAAEMVLSMLFPSETSLKVIRKQARELIAALDTIPEPPAAESEAARTLMSRPTDLKPPEGLQEAIAEQAELEVAAETPTEPPRAEGPLVAYAFVWLPRTETLEPEIAGVILDWINISAVNHHWQLDGVEIQPTYVSVQISISANQTPTSSAEMLMRETAELACDPALWADACYIVAPGRTVTQQEIANFIEYYRDTQHQNAA